MVLTREHDDDSTCTEATESSQALRASVESLLAAQGLDRLNPGAYDCLVDSIVSMINRQVSQQQEQAEQQEHAETNQNQVNATCANNEEAAKGDTPELDTTIASEDEDEKEQNSSSDEEEVRYASDDDEEGYSSDEEESLRWYYVSSRGRVYVTNKKAPQECFKCAKAGQRRFHWKNCCPRERGIPPGSEVSRSTCCRVGGRIIPLGDGYQQGMEELTAYMTQRFPHRPVIIANDREPLVRDLPGEENLAEMFQNLGFDD
ncbi:expressed unknown protein [Seminavis robusta]|uniref:Uncharacterized protein n=1 Tax=Seminavis robusta TaxID=568900 RepID=A0A9N8DQ67_9STRA|nr:expressed unknown protein [Seminavis robusta]|eukprot:Sro293_g109870.1 n/a (260) ;mRNA; f:30729-31508